MQRVKFDTYDAFMNERQTWGPWKRVKNYANISAFLSDVYAAQGNPRANLMGKALGATGIKNLSDYDSEIAEDARKISENAGIPASVDLQHFSGGRSNKWIVVIRADSSATYRKVVVYSMDAP
jgi:hypothetical protein